ncbi:hypothetical protein BJ878DRAFT_516815 [Calycina marina]|uniref:Uncharacterized protein n=1 Tax=Calycina marina TaxID=1763456 RepID=A0A9P7YYQ9_9HELO|nr:hypothetical protein BJ878DRAFT_516815 [Calycina marina]
MMDRGRDRRSAEEGEVTRIGAGESYRPAGGRRDNIGRRDDIARRDDMRRDDIGRCDDRGRRDDSGRRDDRRDNDRPRSPMRRFSPRREKPRSSYRRPYDDRPRSPIRRFSPRRDDDRRDRHRSPMRRIDRRRSISPYDRNRPPPRARSPLPRRSRSPPNRGPARQRSPSPRRGGRPKYGPSSADWRRRSPSPAIRIPAVRSPPSRSPAPRDDRTSSRNSANTSRPPSPQIHPSRFALVSTPRSDVRVEVKTENKPRSPAPSAATTALSHLVYRDRDTREVRESRDLSSKTTPRERSPLRHVATRSPLRQAPLRSPPRAPSGFRPPTGPGSSRKFSTSSISPTINHSSIPHKSDISSFSGPPAGPRGYDPLTSRGGYRGRGRGEYRGDYGRGDYGRGDYGRGGYGRGSFGSDRGGRPDWGAAPRRLSTEPSHSITPSSRLAPIQAASVLVTPSEPSPSAPAAPTGPAGGVPTGPRVSAPSRTFPREPSSMYSGRSVSISAASGPRLHPAMTNLSQIITGGKIDPTASGLKPDATIKQKKLEDNAEALRNDLHAKQAVLRKSLKEYEELKQMAASWSLRSELSERHVRQLAGEGVGGAAF